MDALDVLVVGAVVAGLGLAVGVFNVLLAVAEHRRAQASSVLKHAGLLEGSVEVE